MRIKAAQPQDSSRQQAPAGGVREMRFLLVRTRMVQNTYQVRTYMIGVNTYASKRYKMYLRHIKATIVMLYRIICTTYRIAVSHISPYIGRYISYIT